MTQFLFLAALASAAPPGDYRPAAPQPPRAYTVPGGGDTVGQPADIVLQPGTYAVPSGGATRCSTAHRIWARQLGQSVLRMGLTYTCDSPELEHRTRRRGGAMGGTQLHGHLRFVGKQANHTAGQLFLPYTNFSSASDCDFSGLPPGALHVSSTHIPRYTRPARRRLLTDDHLGGSRGLSYTLDDAFRLIERQGEQLAELRALHRPAAAQNSNTAAGPGGDGMYGPSDDDDDDTALLDRLALAGGAIALEPRVYRRRGTWKLSQNGTHVRGWAGITRLLVQEASPGTPFSGIHITACPDDDRKQACTYGNQYSYDKPLQHVYVSGISIEIVQNQTLDHEGHCCGHLSDPHNQHGGNGNGMYGLLVTNVASGHAIDITVSGAHFQGIGLVNTASFHLVRPTSNFCFSVRHGSLFCAAVCTALTPKQH